MLPVTLPLSPRPLRPWAWGRPHISTHGLAPVLQTHPPRRLSNHSYSTMKFTCAAFVSLAVAVGTSALVARSSLPFLLAFLPS